MTSKSDTVEAKVDIIESQELSYKAKMLYIYLDRYLRKWGGDNISILYAEIKQDLGLYPATSRKYLMELRDKGYITWERKYAYSTPDYTTYTNICTLIKQIEDFNCYKGCILPNATPPTKFAYSDEISNTARLVYNCLVDLYKKYKICIPKQDSLCQWLNISKKALQECLGELKAKGYIKGKPRYIKGRFTYSYELFK